MVSRGLTSGEFAGQLFANSFDTMSEVCAAFFSSKLSTLCDECTVILRSIRLQILDCISVDHPNITKC